LLNIDGVVQGEVQEVTLATPSRKVQVKQKKRYCELAGGEIGANTQLNTPAAKANLLFQNKKEMISASYDTNQTIWIGYNFSILNIKGNKMHIYFVVYLHFIVFYNDIVYVPSSRAVEGSILLPSLKTLYFKGFALVFVLLFFITFIPHFSTFYNFSRTNHEHENRS
jgi:hypothetical protein